MTEHPTENDLLDLIEGRLPPDRVEVVRAALTADRALLARVEGLARDRRLLRATAITDPRAPRTLSQESIARAEREALFAGPARSNYSLTTRPLLAGLALAAGVAIAIAGAVLTLTLITRPQKITQDGLTHAATSVPVSNDTVAAPDPLASQEPGVPFVPSAPIVVVPVADPVIDAWTNEITQKSAQPEPNPAELPWLTEETVKLALEGRLRLLVPAGVLVAQSSDAPAPISMIERPRRLAVRYKTDEGAEGIRRALAQLPAQLPGVPPAMIRAAENEPASAPAALEPVSLDPDDVLWWTRAASEWASYSSVYVMIEPADSNPK